MELDQRCDSKLVVDGMAPVFDGGAVPKKKGKKAGAGRGAGSGGAPPPKATPMAGAPVRIATVTDIQTCKVCRRAGHYPEQCPVKAARDRGWKSTGKPCTLCVSVYPDATDHADIHHRLAGLDAGYSGRDGAITWAGRRPAAAGKAHVPSPAPAFPPKRGLSLIHI